jgi:hypothetical protein
MPAGTTQLVLPLDLPVMFRGEVLPDRSNAEARIWLARVEEWPVGRLALFGPEGVGKSHLLQRQAEAHGWRMLSGPALRGVPEPAPTALDDADAVAEEAALFHLINACAAQRLPLLLAGRAPPSRWPVRLPDLQSRPATSPSASCGCRRRCRNGCSPGCRGKRRRWPSPPSAWTAPPWPRAGP